MMFDDASRFTSSAPCFISISDHGHNLQGPAEPRARNKFGVPMFEPMTLWV